MVDDKWMARLSAAVQGELDRVSQTLTGRIRELAERYATPLPQLTDEVDDARRPRRRTPQEDGGDVEVRPGYKRTEVGVIPEDWECQAGFGETVRFRRRGAMLDANAKWRARTFSEQIVQWHRYRT